jgi:hypothetical protein
MPQYIKQLLEKKKPCISNTGLLIQSGETAYGSYSAEKGRNIVYECNNGRWVPREDLTKPSIKPSWETQDIPSEKACHTQTSIIPPGGITGTLTDLQICLNGELANADCKPGVNICSSPTISETCSEIGQWRGVTCLRGCDSETGKCKTEDPSMKPGDKENGERCSGLSDTSCKGICSPTPYGWYCLSAEVLTSSPHQLGELKCDGNFLKEFQNGAWIIAKNCTASGCRETDQGIFCATQTEMDDIRKEQEREQNQKLASCIWQCDKRYAGKAICILKTDTNGEIKAECLEISSVVQKESLLDAYTSTQGQNIFSYGSSSQDIKISACGGSGERCCTKQEVGAGEQICNTGLACNEELNRCIISSAQQLAAIIAKEIASSNKISVEEINSLITLNAINDFETQESIINYLRENKNSLCDIPCDVERENRSTSCYIPCNGTCTYSDEKQKYTCVVNSVIDNYFINEYEGGEYGLERSDKEGDLGNRCQTSFFGKKTCNDPWLTCNSNDICELTTAAKTLTANEVLENSGASTYLNTQLIVEGEEVLELALNRELASGGCVENNTFFMKNGICWRCNNVSTKSMSQAPSLDFCQNITLAGLYPGTQCKNIGGYCAKEKYANKQDVTNHGAMDCYSGALCVSKNIDSSKSGLNESCREEISGTSYAALTACSPGLSCHKGICQDDITLAYDDEYAGGRLATGLEEALPILKFIVSPVIRSFTPSYYNSNEIRAQVGLSMIENIGGNEEVLFSEAPELSNANLGSLIFESLDEAAKANATVARALELPTDINNSVFVVGSKVWSFASVYTGEPPLSRGGAAGTNAFYEFASQQSDINQALANEEITKGQARGMRFVSAIKPGFQAAFVAADALPVLKIAGRAINAVGVRSSSVALRTTGRIIAAPTVGTERLASGIIGFVGNRGVVQRIGSSSLVRTTKAVVKAPFVYSMRGISSITSTLARAGIGSQRMIIGELTEAAVKELTEEVLEKGAALTTDDIVERAVQIAKARGRSVTDDMIRAQINIDLTRIMPSMAISDDLFGIIADDISEIARVTSKNSDDIAIELAEKVSKAQNISFEEALSQTKRVTEALELADRWSVNLSEVGARENFVQTYNTLLERVSIEGAALSEAEARLLFGSLGEESVDKIVGGLIFDESSLVTPKSQSFLQNIGLADESGNFQWPWERDAERAIVEVTEKTARQSADEFLESIGTTAESWGENAVSSGLMDARGNLDTHAESILRDIESYIPELPPEYQALSTTLEKIEYIQINFDDLFTDNALAQIGRDRINNPVLSEISYPRSSFLNLDTSRHRILQEIIEKTPEIDSIRLTLFTDGQELISITRGGDEKILRIKDIVISPAQARSNLSQLPEFIPKTEMQIVDGRAVFFIEKIEINYLTPENPELIASYARRLTEETGFIPDIHGANFVTDINGNIFYVDQDIFDYMLTSPYLFPDEKAIAQTEEAIANYLSRQGVVPSEPSFINRNIRSEDGIWFPQRKPIHPGEVFNPEYEVQQILKAPSNERKALLETFKKKQSYQQSGIVEMEENIVGVIRNNPDIPNAKLLSIMDEYSHKYGFSVDQIDEIKLTLESYEKQRARINSLRNQYPTDLDLFRAAFGYEPKGKIKIEDGVIAFEVTLHSEEDVAIIHSEKYKILINKKLEPGDTLIWASEWELNSAKEIGGFFQPGETFIENSDGLFLFTKHTSPQAVIVHEEQHVIYNFFQGPLEDSSYRVADLKTRLSTTTESTEQISAIRDFLKAYRTDYSDTGTANEILAYTKMGSANDSIENILTRPRSEGGLYDFYLEDGRKIRSFLSMRPLNNDVFLVLDEIIAEELGNDAYMSLVQDSLGAYKILEAKGFSKDQAVILLQNEPITRWPKVAKRAPSPVSDNILERLEFFLTEIFNKIVH